MNRRLVVSLVMGVAMAGASALTDSMTPRAKIAAAADRFDLDAMIPASFAEWQIDASVVPLAPDPERQSVLEKIYDQTLSRTYINKAGERVMLSIAYGGDQSKALQLHLPEVCYTAQGFEMLKAGDGVLASGYGEVPVKRMVARLNSRNEPITYWITIGDRQVLSGLQLKIQRMAYGMAGQIPDGMLVRVSTIEADARHAYSVQDRFVGQMLAALSPRDRARLLGSAASNG